MTIKEQKTALRKYYLALREELRSAEKDEAIRACVRTLSGGSFFIYCAVKSEVATQGIIADFMHEGKRVCLPRITGQGEMVAAPYAGEALEAGAFSVPAPKRGEDEPCEIALVPLVAVDLSGARLGYGGGYYDAYFKTHPNMLRVGLGYRGQVAPRLPREEHDVLLHAIVTEDGIQRLDTFPCGVYNKKKETE